MKDSCWLWQGRRQSGKWNYGIVTIGGKRERAHRFIWETEYGPIPEGVQVCHICDTPPCFRPSHLFLGTQRDNMLDMHLKARDRNGNEAKDRCPRGHPYHVTARGWRACRACEAERSRRRRAA